MSYQFSKLAKMGSTPGIGFGGDRLGPKTAEEIYSRTNSWSCGKNKVTMQDVEALYPGKMERLNRIIRAKFSDLPEANGPLRTVVEPATAPPAPVLPKKQKIQAPAMQKHEQLPQIPVSAIGSGAV